MIRAFQWDLARQVERLDWLLAQLPRYAEWGYNELYLHLEDAVEYPSLPGVARADAYSYRDMERLVNAATRAGIKVVPIVNLLGHTQYLVKVPELRDLNELRAPDGSPLERGQICPVHPRTPEIAEMLLRDMAPFCTGGKVHVGLDESFHIGKHPLSRKEVERIGLAAHFARYTTRLRDLTRSLGLNMGMWADMLYFLPEALPLMPADVAAYEWYYYSFRRRPRVELHNFAESDLGERLRARGIGYWGCPMNGAFRFEPLPHFTDRLENILSWWSRCHRLNAAGMLVTSWEPYRLAIELTTVIDAAAASLWMDGVDEPKAMLERGFARVFGKRTLALRRTEEPGRSAYQGQYSPKERQKARTAARVALACDKYPFSGYPRWEINWRWDVVSRREPLAGYRREVRHFERLRNIDATRFAPPLRASIDLRWALAARDLWVHEAQCGAKPDVRMLESILQAGVKSAREMWARTRSAEATSPNEEILRRDLDRLAALRRGEPVLGPEWQLCYTVENFAPAAQLVAVEQQLPDGTWVTRQACHTIEFQAVAAKARGGLTREHAAPIEWNGDTTLPPILRFALRGIGLVRLADVAVTNGSTHLAVPMDAKTVGRPAPRRGFPDLEWAANAAVLPLSF